MSQDPAALNLPFIVRDHLRFEGAASFDLEVITASTLATTLEITGMTREGPFRLNLITDGLTVAQTSVFRLPDVPIWLTIKTAGITASVNNVFAMAYVRANQTRLQLLCQGFVGQFGGINFPNQVPPTPLQLHGNVGRVAVTDPAAGLNWSATIPAGQYWRIHQIYFTLTTDATVATRAVRVTLRDPGATTTSIPTAATQAASLAVIYSCFKGAVAINDATANIQSFPFPQELLLAPGYIISVSTSNMQAADDYSAISIYRSIFYSE